MFSVTLAFVLSASVPVKVASPGLSWVGVEPALGEALLDSFVTRLAEGGQVRVTTQRDIAQVLGLERQKALQGCTEGTNCTAELAAAMGVNAVLSGSLVKLESTLTITVRLVRADDGSSLVIATHRGKTWDDLQDWLDAQAPTFRTQLHQAFAQSRQPAGQAEQSFVAPFVVGGTGLAVAAVGGVLFGLGKDDATKLATSSDPVAIEKYASEGPVKQGLGVGLLVAGLVGVAGAVVLRLQEGATTAAWVPVPGGGALVVAGRFP